MQEYHLLKVENEVSSQTYHLNTSTVIIGRNTLSGISVNDDHVLSHHAVLRRISTIGTKHAFALISNSGKVVTLGDGQVFEANQLNKTLVTGDVFQIGATRFSYMIAYMTEADYSQHFNATPVLLNSNQDRKLVFNEN